MLNTTLAVAVLSAASAISPFANLLHLHPHAAVPDTRIAVVIDNPTNRFVDLTVEGHTYTVPSGHNMRVTAPAGTVVYAASTTFSYHPGQQVAALTPALNGAHIVLR